MDSLIEAAKFNGLDPVAYRSTVGSGLNKKPDRHAAAICIRVRLDHAPDILLAKAEPVHAANRATDVR